MQRYTKGAELTFLLTFFPLLIHYTPAVNNLLMSERKDIKGNSMCYIVRKVIRIALMDWDAGQSHSMDREEFAEFKGEAMMRCGRKSKDTYEPTVYLSLNSAKNGAKEVLGKTLQSFKDLETSSAEIEWDCFQVRLLVLIASSSSFSSPTSFFLFKLNVVTFDIPKLEDVFDFENDDLLWKAKFIYTYQPRGDPDL